MLHAAGSKTIKALALRVAVTLITLRIAARQDLYLLRNLPTLLLAIPLLQYIPNPHVQRYLGSPLPASASTSKSSSRLLGALEGLQLSLFFWSLLKLPAAAAIAFHLLSEPILQLTSAQNDAFTFKSASRRTWFSLVFLLLVPLRVLPLTPSSFIFAIVSVLLGCSIQVANRRGSSLPAQTSSGDLHRVVASVVSAFLLALATPVLGQRIYFIRGSILKIVSLPPLFVAILLLYRHSSIPPPPHYPTTPVDTLAISLALLLSSIFPTMGARIRLYDVVLIGAVAAMAAPLAFESNPESILPEHSSPLPNPVIDDINGDKNEKDQAQTAEGPTSPSNHSITSIISTLSTPPSPLQRWALISILIPTLLMILSAELSRSSIPGIPHSQRWDTRPYTHSSNSTWKRLPHTLYHSHRAQELREAPTSTYVPPQLEVVISYYNEPIAGVVDIVRRAFAEVPTWTKTSTLYHKGMRVDADPLDGERMLSREEINRRMRKFVERPELAGWIDTAIAVKSEGRDGGTYLKHIIDNYDRLADFTIFMQGHVPWPSEYDDRLKLINERTGFISFGHYLAVKGGIDLWYSLSFQRIGQIWSLFQSTNKEYTSQTRHLATYHGEFGVSRARIQRTPRDVYEHLYRVLTAPKDDPIYGEEGSWGYKGVANGPDNPFFGHSLERSWTFMFNCIDARIERWCWLDHPASAACYCADDQTWFGGLVQDTSASLL